VRTLAIECATEACSVALFDEDRCVANVHEVIGRGHAERLLPAIATLPDKGRADRILVSLGPGSFTGVRIGLAAARALGLAWGVDVLGYPTMALVAAMARIDHPHQSVTVCMTGGHGEWFVQDFDGDGSPGQPVLSLAPDAARNRTNEYLIAGSKAAECLGGDGRSLVFLPDAQRVMHLPFALLTIDLSPIYGRPPDAKLPHEVQRKGNKGA
jgi:tRNA threonylcarbamoyladenosine biosynthesis protein TsaB